MKRTMLIVISIMMLVSLSPVYSQDTTTLTLWRHETGDAEVNQNLEAIARFNEMQDAYEVVFETLPQGTYTESIQAASLAGDLPCIFDMDQPTVPNFAWSGNLIALDGLVSQEVVDSITIGGKGFYNGELYSLGQFDVALTVFVLQETLDEFGFRVPTTDEPWTLDEFNAALETIAASGNFEYPLDINAAWGGEWLSYGYSPWLQSFGGDLIDRESYLEAEGVLNGDEAIAFGEWFQGLFDNGLVDPAPVDGDGFVQQRVAMHYTGSWELGRYTETFGDTAIALPVPDFGTGPAIGAGSWQWGVSSSCEHPEGAAEFLKFLMSPEEIADFSNVTSLIPTSAEGAALTELFAEGGTGRNLFVYAEQFAIIRPETPGYPFISSTFEQALNDIMDGSDVQDALDDAVDAIEQDIEDNGGYGFEM